MSAMMSPMGEVNVGTMSFCLGVYLKDTVLWELYFLKEKRVRQELGVRARARSMFECRKNPTGMHPTKIQGPATVRELTLKS